MMRGNEKGQFYHVIPQFGHCCFFAFVNNVSIVNKPSCTVGKLILTGQLLVSVHPLGVVNQEVVVYLQFHVVQQ